VTFTGFLHRLDQCIDPALNIHLVMDNGPSHITGFTIRYNRTAKPWTWTYDARADHARHSGQHPATTEPATTRTLPQAA
jgi:hypothetical protein